MNINLTRQQLAILSGLLLAGHLVFCCFGYTVGRGTAPEQAPVQAPAVANVPQDRIEPTATITPAPTNTPTPKPPPPPTETTIPTDTPVPPTPTPSLPTATPTPSLPQLEILSHQSYVDVGWFHIVGEVQNNSDTPVEFVKVVATLYDDAGQVVGTDFTYTEIDVIPLGGKSPFETGTDEWTGTTNYKLQVQGDAAPCRDRTL